MIEEPTTIEIKVPNNIGLTPDQVAKLKKLTTIRILSRSGGAVRVNEPEQIVFRIVNGPPVEG